MDKKELGKVMSACAYLSRTFRSKEFEQYITGISQAGPMEIDSVSKTLDYFRATISYETVRRVE